jgi:hypothetical protein
MRARRLTLLWCCGTWRPGARRAGRGGSRWWQRGIGMTNLGLDGLGRVFIRTMRKSGMAMVAFSYVEVVNWLVADDELGWFIFC